MSPAEELAWELKSTGMCLDILKDVPPSIRARVVRKLFEIFATEDRPASGQPSTIPALVESEEFRAIKIAQEQYRMLLALLQGFDFERFKNSASKQAGRTRKYFAATKAEILASGTSTDPIEISPGGWWADVNCSTEEKRSRVKRIMHDMGYLPRECEFAASAIR